MKKTSAILLYTLMSACLFVSCSNDDEEPVVPEPELAGYIDMYYNGKKTEFKEIYANYYLNSDRDTLGSYYTGYLNEYHSPSRGAVFLYISRDLKLERVEFYYSPEGTNYSTQFVNYTAMYDDERTPLELQYSVGKEVITGEFSGKLFNAAEIINVDSCKFYIQDKRKGRYR